MRGNGSRPPARTPRRVKIQIVPDHRSHRGAGPEDARLFGADAVPRMRAAVGDLSWLLSRGYAQPSAVKIVGDRYTLDARQRMATTRSACTDRQRDDRISREVSSETLAGNALLIDGYNVLTTIEVAMGGGVILRGRDTAFRDIAGVHGTYRKVEETSAVIEAIGATAAELGVVRCAWFLDSPVSNSGRLKGILRDAAAAHGWDWTIELVQNPDAVLIASDRIIASSDSVVLDGCARWFNLAAAVIQRRVPNAWIVDLAE